MPAGNPEDHPPIGVDRMPAAENSRAKRYNPIRQWPVLALAWLAIASLLYVGKAAFAPILFAVLLAMLLSPLVDFLERHRLPRSMASLFAVGALIAVMLLVLDAAWSPTLGWVDRAPAVLQKVEQKIRPLQRMIARIESVTTRASTLTNAAPARRDSAPSASSTAENSSGMDALRASRTILIDLATVSILTVFLLIAGGRTLRNIEAALVGHTQSYQCILIVEAVRRELSRYFSTLTLINVGLGLATTGVVALWGLPNPWLWGTMAGVLNFIPYIGPTVTLFVLSIVSLVSFEGYGAAIGVAGSFLAIATIEGQFVQPLLVGFRLNLNPIVLFIAIWLAGWFWGVAGVILATPVLITLKEIANRQVETSVLKAILMGNPKPLFIKHARPTDSVAREKQFPL